MDRDGGGVRYAARGLPLGATFDRDTSYTQLYREADRHLFAAKRDGRNRVDITALPPSGAGETMMLH